MLRSRHFSGHWHGGRTDNVMEQQMLRSRHFNGHWYGGRTDDTKWSNGWTATSILASLTLRQNQSGQNHLARNSERGKKTRQTEEEVGRQHQGMDRPGVRHVREGSGEQGKMEETGCEIICGAPTTLVVK